MSPFSIRDLLKDRAKKAPDQVALKYKDDTLTFRELEKKTNCIAQKLSEKNINKGTRVLLAAEPGIELISIFFALFKLGAVPIVMDSGLSFKNFLRCVRQSKPEILILGYPILFLLSFLPAFRSIKRRILPFRWGKREKVSFEKSKASDLAAILFTSGSTGPAKGVCYTYGHFAAQLELLKKHYGIQPGEIDLPLLPIFALFNPALGMTTVVPEINSKKPSALNPEKIVQSIQSNQVTNSFGAPTLWAKIADFCEEKALQLHSLKRILMAGCSVPFDLLERMQWVAPNAEIHTPYGATECLPITTIDAKTLLKTRKFTAEGKGTCVGAPLKDIFVKIIPIVDGPVKEITPLPPYKIGEIIVSGPVVTEKYDANIAPETKITEKKITWHRMGDTGYLDKENRLWFCGRKAERVVTPHTTLFPDCCENIFNEHGDVERCALIGLGEKGAQIPALVIQPKAGIETNHPYLESIFLDNIRFLAKSNPLTHSINTFFITKKFPVDVRHNAKIHRLKLAQDLVKKRGSKIDSMIKTFFQKSFLSFLRQKN